VRTAESMGPARRAWRSSSGIFLAISAVGEALLPVAVFGVEREEGEEVGMDDLEGAVFVGGVRVEEDVERRDAVGAID